MERFLERHRDRITGVLSGFDRIRFQGTLKMISHRKGLDIFLYRHGVAFKDFGAFAERLSDRIKEHAQALAHRLGRPYLYLESPRISKEDLARRIMERDKIHTGLICVLACIESCQSFKIRRDAERRHLLLEPAKRRCLHLYFYFVDREFGFMHVRLQTWLPFTFRACLNGREWLARQMDRAGIGYERRDNCFTRIDDLDRAQRICDKLAQRHWPRILDALAERLNPWVGPHGGLDLRGYYWTLQESEYATDVMFRDTASLQEVYARLFDHAIRQFRCDDVLRFLGRRIHPACFNGDIVTDVRKRPEGRRIKHRVEENSIKMYDKQGSVLRIETTINNPRRFKVRRLRTRDGRREMRWVPMRKGVADMPRREELGRAANARYLEALSVVGEALPTRCVLDPVSAPVTREGRPYRPLRPIDQRDADLFRVLLRGEFLLQGFRNKDLRRHLGLDPEKDPVRRRKLSGRVTRWLRLFRAHGLIRKVSTTRYYRVTDRGHRVMTTALRLREIDVNQLAA